MDRQLLCGLIDSRALTISLNCSCLAQWRYYPREGKLWPLNRQDERRSSEKIPLPPVFLAASRLRRKTLLGARTILPATRTFWTNQKCAHISPLPGMETQSASQKFFPSPLPSLNVVLKVWRCIRLLFRWQNSIDQGRGGSVKIIISTVKIVGQLERSQQFCLSPLF